MSEEKVPHTLVNCQKQLQTKALEYCYSDYYDLCHIDYNIMIIENLMCNGRCHLVAVFKNYLIEDDKSEYLRRFYKKKESSPRLKKLFAYHEETSVIFPNYVPLVESKYLYNNVIKKQRVIDEQQSLDKIRKDNKLKKVTTIKKEERMFNSTIVGEILTSNRSLLRIVFGLEFNNNKIVNNNDNKKNEDSDCEDFNKLINELEKAEENADNINDNSLEGFNLTNKASKYKLKLGNKLNYNIQTKNKSTDKQYNITNNSTNITSSSNTNNINIINNNTNLKKYKNNNLILKDNSVQSNLKISKKLKNPTLNITNPNKKHNEDINKYKSRNYQTTISSKTLYGLNFHSSSKIINNLMSKEKKINLKSKSNTNHNHIQKNEKVKSGIYNNNYIFNNNFPQNLKINERNINFFNNLNPKMNIIVKSYNDKTQIPKIDINKIKLINNIQDNKLSTNTNRHNARNNNYILNNPNLFFTETDVLKSDRNSRKKNLKKNNNIKSKFGPIIAFSPLKLSSKIFVEKNNNKLIVTNEKIFKSMNHRNIKVNQYLTNSNNIYPNQNLNKNKKNLVINEYNYKVAPKKNQEQNYINKLFK